MPRPYRLGGRRRFGLRLGLGLRLQLGLRLRLRLRRGAGERLLLDASEQAGEESHGSDPSRPARAILLILTCCHPALGVEALAETAS